MQRMDETVFDTPEATAEGDTLGERITRAREAVSLTSAQLARRLGVKSTTVSGWELDRSEPRSNKLVLLAGVLRVSPAWLLTGVGDSPSLRAGDGEIEAIRANLLAIRDQAQTLADQVDRIVERLDSFESFNG